jgi:hypothetical protein
VIAIDPKNVEARAWQAWITAKAAIQLSVRGKLSDELLAKTLETVEARIAAVRADAPAAGDPACIDTVLRTYRGDTTGATEALAVCRTSVADPGLRDDTNATVAAQAGIATEGASTTTSPA